MLKVLFEKASDWQFEDVRRFENYQQFIEWMENQYDSWIVEFDWYKSEESKCDIKAQQYDYYVE